MEFLITMISVLKFADFQNGVAVHIQNFMVISPKMFVFSTNSIPLDSSQEFPPAMLVLV